MKRTVTTIFVFIIFVLTLLFANMVSFAYVNDLQTENEITYSFDKTNGELCIEGYGMRWAVWSIQYCLDFDENIDSSEVKKLIVKDGLTILDCHSLVGSLFEWENLTEMTLPKSIEKIQGDFSKCPSLKTINYAGTKEDWDKIIFRDNQKELFSKMTFNYSVDVPKSDSGFAGKDNEIVTVKIQPYEKITCTLDCITEKLVVSGNGPLYISSGYYDAYFSIGNLFANGHTQDDAWTPHISDIVIEEGITKLCEGNFEIQGFNSISIPKSVTKIEKSCFGTLADDEKSSLEVYYAGTKEDWDKIKIGKYNEVLTRGNIHYSEDVSTDNEESSNTAYIILGISAAVVLIGTATVVLAVKKRKNK